jgi:hypothetical protein
MGMPNTNTATVVERPDWLDPSRILQVRALDPEVKRQIKIEAATENVSLATLVEAMWLAYQRAGGHERAS